MKTNMKTNQKIQSELLILVNHIKTNSKHKRDNNNMKTKILQLQKQQHILLKRILNLSKLI
jgi:hypothetical protein